MIVTPPQRRTGWVFERDCLRHESSIPAGAYAIDDFESPLTKSRFAELVDASGMRSALVPLPVTPVSRDDVERLHESAYVDRVVALSQGEGGDAGDFCWVGPGSYELALLAAGGTYAAVSAVLRGEVDNAYALVRPPGHHAEPGRGRGYCIFGNIAVAVLKARAELGLGRVVVVDWDVHHGNGTETAFAADPLTLTISIHQDRLYPEDSGLPGTVGEPGALGSVVNVALPPGSGTGAYEHAVDRVVLPALERFRPELVIVACGFDGGGLDPLGRMLLPASGFGELTRRLLGAADELCGGRLVLSHEGGYSVQHVPFCGLAVLEALSGARTDVDDPFSWVGDDPHQRLAEHQRAAVADTVAAHRRLGARW